MTELMAWLAASLLMPIPAYLRIRRNWTANVVSAVAASAVDVVVMYVSYPSLRRWSEPTLLFLAGIPFAMVNAWFVGYAVRHWDDESGWRRLDTAEARTVLRAELDRYRQLPYAALASKLCAMPVTMSVRGPSGAEYIVECDGYRDDDRGALRVDGAR